MSIDAKLSTLAGLSSSQALGKINPNAAEEQEKADLQKACRMFEAHFLKMMMSEMRKSVEKTDFNHGGMGEDIFTSMMDQAVADDLTAGGSMGIADLLERQLSLNNSARPGANLDDYQKQLGAAVEMIMPVAGKVSSSFGKRLHPITGIEDNHSGLDLAAPQGTPVMAAMGGVVSFAGEKGGYGKLVVVDHPDGSQAFYGHLSKFDVQEGQSLALGQTLGAVGSTGASTGPHLHFELRNANGAPVDPMPQLAAGGASFKQGA